MRHHFQPLSRHMRLFELIRQQNLLAQSSGARTHADGAHLSNPIDQFVAQAVQSLAPPRRR